MTAGGSHTFSALAQRQLRLMRSKLSIFTMGWYDAVTFDLIRHAKRRDTFPSRGRLSLRWFLRMEFGRLLPHNAEIPAGGLWSSPAGIFSYKLQQLQRSVGFVGDGFQPFAGAAFAGNSTAT